MFDDKYHPQIKKDLKALNKNLVEEIREKHINVILENPYINEKLSGPFRKIYSYHFANFNISYRICYMVNKKENTIYFLLIAKRENIYDILKRRL